MHMKTQKIKNAIAAFAALLAMVIQPCLTAGAVTVYGSDGNFYDEGYIVIGESHAIGMSIAVGAVAKACGNVFKYGGSSDISFDFVQDSSIEEYNTFNMKGNLFFVYEGNRGETDGKLQSSHDYIYSDGKGNHGRGVEKIHEIMNMNPNIVHWNIISIGGASAASRGKGMADKYASAYRNWIEYEFPAADCYFLSVSTMTKHYRPVKDKKIFNNTLAAAFPDKFLDYTEFYTQRYPQSTVDTIHWDNATYIDLISDVFRKIEQNRKIYAVQDLQAVMYTNDTAAIFEKPSPESAIILPSCAAGLPVQVTGLTYSGYFRVCLDENGKQGYIAQTGLSASK